MKPNTIWIERAALWSFILLVFLTVTCGGSGAVGCAPFRNAAGEVAYVSGATSTSPSTRPSAAREAGRGAVELIKYVYPPAGAVIAGIGGIAALFAGAGHSVGKRRTFAQLGGALGEVADDLLVHKEPGVPFSDPTRKALESIGRHDVAAVPTSSQLITDYTIGPIEGFGSMVDYATLDLSEHDRE